MGIAEFLKRKYLALRGRLYLYWYRVWARSSVEYVGRNWRDDDALPILVLFGFNPWKRQFYSNYFSNYRTAFVRGKASFYRVKRDLLRQVPRSEIGGFVGWGIKLPRPARRYASARLFGLIPIPTLRRISVFTIEDGFLRSMGGGLLHTRPASICIDSVGIYFNGERPSEVEKLLNTYDFNANPELMARAEAGLQLMRDARLTKYYDLDPYKSTLPFKTSGRYAILVVGQVEDDASIKKSKAVIKTNLGLIQQAREDHPDADIYFRPHPDYWVGIRKKKRKAEFDELCAVVPPEVSVYEMFNIVDEIYTISSLVGFEALVFGKKVSTFGVSFYSNWGLTNDAAKVSRRRRDRNLSLTELFAGVYLEYPKYIHPLGNVASSFEDIASYFIVEVLKHKDLFELNSNELFSRCKAHIGRMSAPMRLLDYLQGTGSAAAGDTAKILECIGDDLRLQDYAQISFLLISSSNYDALVAYTNQCLALLGENAERFCKDTRLLEVFLYSVTQALIKSNGRVISHTPDISRHIVNIPQQDENFIGIVRNYTKALSFNLQYREISILIDRLKFLHESPELYVHELHKTFHDHVRESQQCGFDRLQFRILAQVLHLKPSRSERDSDFRYRLRLRAAEEYLKGLDARYPSPVDAVFNRIQYGVVVEDKYSVLKLYEEFRALQEQLGGSLPVKTKPRRKKRTPSGYRVAEIIALLRYFIRCKELAAAWQVLDVLSNWIDDNTNTLLRLFLLRSEKRTKEFMALYQNAPAEFQRSEKPLGVYARVLREMGLFNRSRMVYQDLARMAKTVAKRASLETEIKKLAFCEESSRILGAVPQPKLPRGVIFLASQTCFNTLAMMVPSLVEAKRLGYAVVNLTEGMTAPEPTGLDFIDQFAGIIPLDLSFVTLGNEWEIDWSKKSIKADGINFYQGFYERLSTFCRRFHVDINMPFVEREFRQSLQRADTCLTVAKKIFSTLAERGIPFTFVSGNTHVTPFSVFRDFARHKNHPLMGFINCNVAYESYFSNLGSKFANTMCVTDMTLHPTIRAPFMAKKDGFESWFAANCDNPDYLEKASALINVNRVGSTDNTSELQIIEQLKELKRRGKKIVCAFGKVPVDLNVPYDGGPAHEDMADWLNHTIEVCGRNDDVYLLVKPHPHELRPEIALDLVEKLSDLITVDVAENVRVLGHKDINGHALAPYLDLAILYNGSSSLELTAQGIPVMMASHFGKHDYPVELMYPESREHYEQFLLELDYREPDATTRKKAAFLMCYLGTSDISTINQYSKRQLTNDNVGVPEWRAEKIAEFLRTGDPAMRNIARQMVEKLEMAR